MSKIHFTKMHGLGNDYIYVDLDMNPIRNLALFSKFWSQPKFGIGADGLVTIETLTQPNSFKMRIFNADGSEGNMCGNATRCIGKFLYENNYTDATEISLETRSGVKVLNLSVENGLVNSVKVDMGLPIVENENLTIELNERKIDGVEVSMGNPHFVHFVDSVASFPLTELGPKVECCSHFLNRTNFEIVELIDKNTLRMKVWERGSAITMACGTGACASAVAAITRGLVESPCKVIMDGGDLSIEWSGLKKDSVFMTGTATKVFSGTLDWDDEL